MSPTWSKTTQTDFNFELILNFVTCDLPRLISYDVVPVLFEVINNMTPEDNRDDHPSTLQQQIENLVRNIVNNSLPNLTEARKYKVLNQTQKPAKQPTRRALNTPATANINIIAEDAEDLRRNNATKQRVLKTINTADCPVCGKDFGTFPTLIVHLPSHKEQLNTLNCKFCKFSSIDTSALASHYQNAHVCTSARTVEYKCPKCDAIYYRQQALTNHMRVHKTDIPKCPRCNVLFEFPSQLATHLKFSNSCGKYTNNRQAAALVQGIPPATEPPAMPPMPAVAPGPSLLPAAVGQKNAANIIGNALLSALDIAPASAGSAGTGNDTVPIPDTTTAQPATIIAEDMIMDVSTGKPIPVSEYLSKHRENAAPQLEVPSAASRKFQKSNYKCDHCGRSFVTVGTLKHHINKVHLLKKTLSCTQCHLLFAHYNDLESHFHRCHRKRKSTDCIGKVLKRKSTDCIRSDKKIRSEENGTVIAQLIIEEDINLNSAATENTGTGSKIKEEILIEDIKKAKIEILTQAESEQKDTNNNLNAAENENTIITGNKIKKEIVKKAIMVKAPAVTIIEEDINIEDINLNSAAKENVRTRSGRSTKAPLNYNQ